MAGAVRTLSFREELKRVGLAHAPRQRKSERTTTKA